jgi:hypothetical protein
MQDAAALLRGSSVESFWSGGNMAMHIYSLLSAVFFGISMVSGCAIATGTPRITEDQMSVTMPVFVSSLLGAMVFGWLANGYFAARQQAVEREIRKMKEKHHEEIAIIERRLNDMLAARNGK